MGHLDFGIMQRLNIEAARKHAGQSELVTPSGPPTGGGGGGGNGGEVTPISLNTPDILNSLLNINPFFETPSTVSQTSTVDPSSTFSSCSECLAGTPEEHEKKVFATLETPICSTSSTAITNTFGLGGLASSPLASSFSVSLPSMSRVPPMSQPSSVELMRSKLIKEGLKHSIQSKRKSSGKGELDVRSELVVKHRKREEVLQPTTINSSSASTSAFLPSLCYHPSFSSSTPDFHAIQSDADFSSTEMLYKLTPEDEERRRRRRERNKVAATKCRNKKKEKTLLLIQESESLEGNNVSMKSEISKLESERQVLMEALSTHAPLCCKMSGPSSNLSSDNRGGTSGGGGNGGGGGSVGGSRGLSSSMMSSQFSTGHHQSVSGCYSSGPTHHSQFHGGGLPHHHHNTYYNNASIQLS